MNKQTKIDRGSKEFEPGEVVEYEPLGWQCTVLRSVKTKKPDAETEYDTYLLKHGEDVFNAEPSSVKKHRR